ncbi:hypothetical protein BGZ54_004965, partial [Gamsiella multidivaricata]
SANKMLFKFSAPKLLLSAVILKLAEATTTNWEFAMYSGSLDVTMQVPGGYSGSFHVPFYKSGTKMCSNDGVFCANVESGPGQWTLVGGSSWVDLYYANTSKRVYVTFTVYDSSGDTCFGPCPHVYGYSAAA